MRVLETERLTLRWFDEADAPFVLGLLNDPAWIANISDSGVRTVDAAKTWIAEKLVTSYWQKGHGLWAMQRKSDGALVGMCGLLERDTLPEIDVGYALAPAFRREGYAREAVQATLRYGRDVLGRSRILAIVSPDNAPSIRVLVSVGMQPDGDPYVDEQGRATRRFAWNDGLPFTSAKAEIDDLVRRFFAAFGNRSGVPHAAALPSMFLPAAVVTVVGDRIESLDVRAFVEPRAALLGGELTDFREAETECETTIDEPLATRRSRYEKSGIRARIRFEGGGTKHFQLVRTPRGWKIAALAYT